jgi:hypothetical protein
MKSKLVVRAVVLAVLVTILGITWQALGGFHAFSTPTLQDLLSANTDINPEEKTDELCLDPLCVEGWGTDIGSFLRFKSAGEAEYWATALGAEGIRYENVVLDLRGYQPTFEQRRHAIDILFSGRDWN